MAANTGRLLRVNLSTGKVGTESVPEQVATDFVGGRGYGIRYLYEELKPDVDPLSEENKLLLLSGPLSGAGAVAVSRWMAVTKSPLTGAYARSVGGTDFGAWLRFAGYELIIIEGKADRPVYLHLTREGCTVESASEIWGKDTKVTQDWLTEKYGRNTRAVCIGPGGEKLVRYAAIVSGRRTAGRCGTGTVMGSKNLKAVAITATRHLQLFDEATFNELAKEQVKIVLANKGFQNHREWGTTRTQNVTNEIGVYPVQNFRYGQQVGYEEITGEEYRKLRTGKFGCYACPARCGMAHQVNSGTYKGAYSEGPEYETIWAFTGNTDSTSKEASIAADALCDDLGIDTISAGCSIGFAYELYEKGLLTRADCDGLELKYGNHEAMVALVKKIANREGIGNLLAEGVARAAKQIGKGAEAYAIHVKGLELPAYEPRGAKTQGFNYVTSNIGASHCFGYAAQDIFGAIEPRPSDRFAEEENADLVVYNQNDTAWHETGIICAFAGRWGWVDPLFGKLLVAARGIDGLEDKDHLHKAGERIFNLERAFNVREGFGRKDDTLPQRMLTEPLHTREAPGEGQIVRRQDKFLDNYYKLRGWSKQGVPTARKLKELGLDSVTSDMTAKRGK
ncbi:MAG: aldehyde ferredoxin oxidoreductase family protein [Chloroflexi bacterium]|nr:aldehyde ferredoxin oxidoreductase family protein [Chloroflexota bacterium]